MKKKVFSALLLAAFSFATTSTLVSCKDYDDDISDLQKQITDGNSSLTELVNAKATSLQEQVTQLQANQKSLEDAYKKADDLLHETISKEISNDLKGYATLENLAAQVGDLKAADVQLSTTIKETQDAVEVVKGLVNENTKNIALLLEANDILNDAASKAQKRADDAYELAQQANSLAQKNAADIERIDKGLSEKIAQNVASIDDLKGRVTTLESTISQWDNSIKTAMEQANDAQVNAATALTTAKSVKEALEEAKKDLTEKDDVLNDRIDETVKKLNETIEDLKDLEEKAEELHKDALGYTDIAKAEVLQKVEEVKSGLELKVSDLDKAYQDADEKLSGRIEDVLKSLNDYKAEVAETYVTLEKYGKDWEDLQNALKVIRGDISTNTGDIEAAVKRLTSAEENIGENAIAIATLEEALENKVGLDEYKVKVDSINNHLNGIKEQIAMIIPALQGLSDNMKSLITGIIVQGTYQWIDYLTETESQLITEEGQRMVGGSLNLTRALGVVVNATFNGTFEPTTFATGIRTNNTQNSSLVDHAKAFDVYYAKVSNAAVENFPTAPAGITAKNTQPGLKKNKYFYPSLVANDLVDSLYVTINPTTIDFSNRENLLALENSLAKENPFVELGAAKNSENLISATRAAANQNGFYAVPVKGKVDAASKQDGQYFDRTPNDIDNALYAVSTTYKTNAYDENGEMKAYEQKVLSKYEVYFNGKELPAGRPVLYYTPESQDNAVRPVVVSRNIQEPTILSVGKNDKVLLSQSNPVYKKYLVCTAVAGFGNDAVNYFNNLDGLNEVLDGTHEWTELNVDQKYWNKTITLKYHVLNFDGTESIETYYVRFTKELFDLAEVDVVSTMTTARGLNVTGVEDQQNGKAFFDIPCVKVAENLKIWAENATKAYIVADAPLTIGADKAITGVQIANNGNNDPKKYNGTAITITAGTSVGNAVPVNVRNLKNLLLQFDPRVDGFKPNEKYTFTIHFINNDGDLINRVKVNFTYEIPYKTADLNRIPAAFGAYPGDEDVTIAWATPEKLGEFGTKAVYNMIGSYGPLANFQNAFDPENSVVAFRTESTKLTFDAWTNLTDNGNQAQINAMLPGVLARGDKSLVEGKPVAIQGGINYFGNEKFWVVDDDSAKIRFQSPIHHPAPNAKTKADNGKEFKAVKEIYYGGETATEGVKLNAADYYVKNPNPAAETNMYIWGEGAINQGMAYKIKAEFKATGDGNNQLNADLFTRVEINGISIYKKEVVLENIVDDTEDIVIYTSANVALASDLTFNLVLTITDVWGIQTEYIVPIKLNKNLSNAKKAF